MLNKRADKLELLRIAESVALEKSIDKELIISSMETGIAKAAKSKFGQDNEIKVLINRDNGDIEIFRKLIVSENPENSNTEIKLEDAINLNEVNKDKAIGDEVGANGDFESGEIVPSVTPGVLEGSNVNPIRAMIALIEHQRDFEEQIKFIKEAKTIDESGNTMMKPS